MKKLLAILGMITCMFGLAACGSAEEAAPVDAATEQQMLEFFAQRVDIIYQICSSGGIEESREDEVVYNGLLGFQSAMEDIGNYLGTNGGTIEYNEDNYVVRINVNGSAHSAVVEMVVDNETAQFTSIATNVNYTFGEKMEKAALNTLLGMGTVFVVLVLISLIISLFGLIPKLTEKKKEPEKAPEEKMNDAAVQISEEEPGDDLELAAVISAAIAAYEGSGSTDGFVVRSIRKVYRK
ncbi:MAG: OadG family protein [Blautia sp.]|nr:OadG family protein [Blautia sp.]MCM1201786.1 OadG family protein [Bacteroides fragilis]